jgi:hypothetical protein
MITPEDAPKNSPAVEAPEFADGTPASVRAKAKSLDKPNLHPQHREILRRLAADPRMRNVWNELLRRKRTDGEELYKEFVHPATRAPRSAPSPIAWRNTSPSSMNGSESASDGRQ